MKSLPVPSNINDMSSDHETVYDTETEYSTDGFDAVFEERWMESTAITNILPLAQISNNTIHRPKPIPSEPSIVDFFRGFVTFAKHGTKRIKEMINYQHRK